MHFTKEHAGTCCTTMINKWILGSPFPGRTMKSSTMVIAVSIENRDLSKGWLTPTPFDLDKKDTHVQQ